MKRPFVVLAAGFVLGEVLALQYQKYWPVLLFLLTAAGAGGFGVPQAEGYAGLRNIRLRGAVRQGLLLLLLLAIFGGLGFARGSAVKGRLDREEAQAGIFSEARPVVSGKVARLEEKEDSWSFYLEDVRAEAGNQSAAFEKVWGYLKKEAAGEREAAEAMPDMRAGKARDWPWESRCASGGAWRPSRGREIPENSHSRNITVPAAFPAVSLEMTFWRFPGKRIPMIYSGQASVALRCGAGSGLQGRGRHDL